MIGQQANKSASQQVSKPASQQANKSASQQSILDYTIYNLQI
jgi:hypothetical protein